MNIYGNGFIAKNLRKIKANCKENYVIYAAGISNSKTKDKKNLAREKKDIKSFIEQIDKNKIIIYISSLAVLDKFLQRDKYVKNKIFIENYLKSKLKRYIILRLTQIVGYNKNPNTITNFIFNKIKNGQKFNVWSNVKRNLIDIEDVKSIFKEIANKKFKKSKIINIYNPKSVSVEMIVIILSKILNKKAKYKLIEYKPQLRGNINLRNLRPNKFSKYFNDKNYTKKILTKYYR